MLGLVVSLFFGVLVCLSIFCPAHLEPAPTAGASIAVDLSTAAVGIFVASVTRWNIITRLLSDSAGA